MFMKIMVIKDLVEVLTPFQWATDLTQGQNVVTVSRGVGTGHGLTSIWANLTFDLSDLRYFQVNFIFTNQ